ncbi:carboxymuconolactone decarboxylase family protein [Aliifodinibius sp. S!AR15-10]|uniref:carboxymuconolactone decarboxylase family protein n=1 Tax=Aliifodinibius sp. S!AR15-10 TaxID=2950437 RepID=UPI00285E412F|nr:carboxymuconolactone decarboxylase family protein [Aliifodinibius sp. S!AR15-10]MDR8389720.1 carboxymuconolactone decarboxylase family protein [Aliifodinibius sp. S!AR15-10]
MDLTIYNPDNAPEESQPLLTSVKENYGFVPNLYGELAESPAALEGYIKLNEILGKTSFNPVEQQLAVLAVSIENECHYCAAAHSTVLKKKLNVDEAIVDAVRNDNEVPDEKLDALVTYIQKTVQTRGFVEDHDLKSFLDAGYTKQHVLEVNLVISLKTISNYTNHLAETPVDEAFESEKLEFTTV